jgi:hypothetical protein
VVDYGFSERQARFLVLVMRHSGLCVKRQYATFAGVANGGEKCNAFFRKLVRRGFAIETACVHNRAHLYHVHSKPLYYAIGDADNRYRRTVPAVAVAERLMRLDAAVLEPDLEWLTKRSEKLAHLASKTDADRHGQRADTPGGDAGGLANQFPGTFPIGIDSSGRVVLLYLASTPWTDDFRTFLVGHTALLSVTQSWTLRTLVPQTVQRAVVAYGAAAREERASPLDATTMRELQHYFFHRRRRTDLRTLPDSLRVLLTRYSEAYGGARFIHLYRRWLANEHAALAPVPPAIATGLAERRGTVEFIVLPHTYGHLFPVLQAPTRQDGQRTTLSTDVPARRF